MSLSWIATPISEDAPCGPDLDATDDAGFIDYYYDALERIPEAYIRPGKMDYRDGQAVQVTPDEVFDPKSVDIATQAATISGLLEQSRDLRLLSLWAQFECLAGRLEPLADVIEAMAEAMEVFGDDLHPQTDGHMKERREALQELAQPIAMVTGLRHMALVGSGTVTLRLLNVADGRFSPHSGEGDVSGSALRSALAEGENAASVEAAYVACTRIADALRKMVSACMTGTTPFSMGVDPTLAVLDEIRAEIASARPDLGGADAPQVPTPDSAETGPAPDAASAPAPRAKTKLNSHAEARQALVAAEVYFERNEPSSASLLLIRQARQLIGQPLVVALETLFPEKCGQAHVDFGAATGFVIPAGRLKALTDEGLPSGVPEAPAPDEVADPPSILSTSDVAAALLSVEEFFHARERSSPVPVLLQRARSYLDKSFQEIVDELIPKPG